MPSGTGSLAKPPLPVLHGQGRRTLRWRRRLRRRGNRRFYRLPGGRKRGVVLAGGALRRRNRHDEKRRDARRNRHRDEEADDLLEQRAPTRQVAEHGRRFDRRHVPRLLHGLCYGLGEHFGESWRRGGLPNGCKDGPSVGIRGRHPSFRHERRARLLAGRPLPQLARGIVFRIVRTDMSFVLCITHTEHSPPMRLSTSPADVCRLRPMR